MKLEIEVEERRRGLNNYYKIKSIKIDGENIGCGIHRMLIDIDGGEMNINAFCINYVELLEDFNKKFLQEKNIKLYQEMEREEK